MAWAGKEWAWVGWAGMEWAWVDWAWVGWAGMGQACSAHAVRVLCACLTADELDQLAL